MLVCFLGPEKKPVKMKTESKTKKKQKIEALDDDMDDLDCDKEELVDCDGNKYVRESERRHANNARER